MAVPYPTEAVGSRTEVYNRYLDYFRSRLIASCRALSDEQLRSSVVPSGWAPMGLLNHMRYVELRWLVWGFLGETVDGDLTADQGETHWVFDPRATLDELVGRWRRRGSGPAQSSPGTTWTRSPSLGRRGMRTRAPRGWSGS